MEIKFLKSIVLKSIKLKKKKLYTRKQHDSSLFALLIKNYKNKILSYWKFYELYFGYKIIKKINVYKIIKNECL